jgi:sugar phosphate isomerase/epimerase
MSKMKGPAIFLAQFASQDAPFDSLANITEWAGNLGYKGVQIPTWEAGLIDLETAAKSRDYCDELKGTCAQNGIEITELSTHLQGQLIAVHPAYNEQFDGFAPAAVHGNANARQEWAMQQMLWAAQASQNLDLTAHATFSGALLWHTMYPWPQRPPGLVETGFKELADRWLPILNAFDSAGVDLC